MEAILEKLGWKKLAAIIVALGFTVLIFAFLSIINIDKNQTSISKNTSQNRTDNSSTGGVNFPPTYSYKTAHYNLSYPEYFNVTTEQNPPTGIESYTTFSDKAGNGKIEVTAIKDQGNTMQKIEEPFSTPDYERETYPIAGKTVDEFVLLTGENEAYHRRLIFVKNKQNIIKVELTYTSSETDYDIERDFLRIVTSITEENN